MPLNLDEVPSSDLIQAICKRHEATVVIATNGETWNITLDGNGFMRVAGNKVGQPATRNGISQRGTTPP